MEEREKHNFLEFSTFSHEGKHPPADVDTNSIGRVPTFPAFTSHWTHFYSHTSRAEREEPLNKIHHFAEADIKETTLKPKATTTKTPF